MHARTLSFLQHDHNFAAINKKGERRTKQVLVLTFFTMIVEVGAGMVLGSMALLADGWHMGTHVAAFMITIIAYRYSRAHADDQTFAFSTGKVGVLGAFASSIALGVVALLMLIESGERLYHPQVIRFDEAIAIACFGLAINLISALLLADRPEPKPKRKGRYDRSHDHEHEHDHLPHHGHTHHHDHNLKAAYVHVLADALTSVLAIVALVLGKYYGWHWLDPVMGIVGAMIISQWSYSLIKETGPVLMDESIDAQTVTAIREAIETDADNRIADLHIWRVAPNHFAVIISLVTHHPKAPEYYKELLKKFHIPGGVNRLSHITVEVTQCPDAECFSVSAE